MATVISELATVCMLDNSTIGEFTYGEFSGHASRQEARKERWHPSKANVRVDANPEHWRVTVGGIHGAWCQVTMPLKPGRTLSSAIKIACGLFNSPADIKPDAHGWFGSFVNL